MRNSDSRQKPIRILLVNDYGIVRCGLKHMLSLEPGFSVIGEAASGLEAARFVEEASPDIVMMHVSIPEVHAFAATLQVSRTNPRTGILVLSMSDDERFLLHMIGTGVRGILLKDSLKCDLVEAIRSIYAGHSYFCPAILSMLVTAYKRQSMCDERGRSEKLTRREREILQLLLSGKSNQQIATSLFLSVYTVKTHRSRIMEKLGVHTLAGLVLHAVRDGVVA